MNKNVELFCQFLDEIYNVVESNHNEIYGESWVDNFPYHTVYFTVVDNKLFEQGVDEPIAFINEHGQVIDLVE